MKLHALALTIAALTVVGCSQPTRLNDAPVAVSGKLSRGGEAVGDVQVSFQPLQQGHPVTLPVSADGTFQGELIPGNYAYFIATSSLPKSAAAIKKIDPKYLEPNLTRSIDVQAGQTLAIVLD
jgi:hypothetical protein